MSQFSDLLTGEFTVWGDRAELDAARHDDLYHLDHGIAEDTVGP